MRQVVDRLGRRDDFHGLVVHGGAAHLQDDAVVLLERRPFGPDLSRDVFVLQRIKVKDVVLRLLDDRRLEQIGAGHDHQPRGLAPVFRKIVHHIAHAEGDRQPGDVGVARGQDGGFVDVDHDRVSGRVADLLGSQRRGFHEHTAPAQHHDIAHRRIRIRHAGPGLGPNDDVHPGRGDLLVDDVLDDGRIDEQVQVRVAAFFRVKVLARRDLQLGVELECRRKRLGALIETGHPVRQRVRPGQPMPGLDPQGHSLTDFGVVGDDVLIDHLAVELQLDLVAFAHA